MNKDDKYFHSALIHQTDKYVTQLNFQQIVMYRLHVVLWDVTP